MDRLTTNEPHDNLSATLNFAYAKDRRVVLSHAAGEYNIDLAEYISLQALSNGCDVSTEDVMEGDCMECDCPVAILNAVAIQAAELRGRLKMIEDILGDTYDLDHLTAALREKAERENPKPLTIEELRQMDGEPVWVSDLKYPSDSGYCVIRASKDLFSEYGDRYYLASIPGNEGGWYAFEKYSEEWIAYRHKPKEDPHG